MMETGVPPTHCCHNSHSSLSQVPIVDDKGKDKVFVSCKRKQQNNNYRLPKEVIFGILLLLPAKVVQEVVRCVCKQWYDIVSDPFFVRAHCQKMPNTSASFILQSLYKRSKMYCADDQDRTKSGKVTKIQLPFPAKVWGSCNGLVLFTDNRDSRKVYLTNPLRKLVVSLPPPVVPVVLQKPFDSFYSFAINSSGQYKMMHISLYESFDRRRKSKMSVFTIGVDKAWRPLDLQHFGNSIWDVSGCLVIEQFVYWNHRYYNSLAMDVDTETLYRISWPNGAFGSNCEKYFISMGIALGVMAEIDNERDIWKLLRLTDVKSSEWTEIDMIDIGAILNKVSNGKLTYYSPGVKPISLIGEELSFLCDVSMTSSSLIRYHLPSESFVSFGVSIQCFAASCFHHAPTLVSLKNATL